MKERNLEQKKIPMRIDLVRHGMTRGNEERRYIGITDEPVLEEDQEQLKKQLTIPENLDRMIEEVTRQELEQELHRKIKLKEGSGKEQSHLDETEGVSEPTLMIGEKTEEEADEPTRMFTGDIGDFIKKKREYANACYI